MRIGVRRVLCRTQQGVDEPPTIDVQRAVTSEEEFSLNSNRSNRRRGRGNRNQGGGNSANRVDSRARGNAPQLLDKYKKLAQDAQHNGDRVQAEYYLQFADHYFRVISDNKARQEEARAKRQEERGQANDDSDDDDSDDRDDRRKPRRGRNQRDNSRDQGRRDDGPNEGQRGVEGEAADERSDERKPRRAKADGKPVRRKKKDDNAGSDEIDVGVLPPAIGGDDGDGDEKPRRRSRASKPDDESGGDDLKAVG